MAVFHPALVIERQVAADRKAEGLYRLYLAPAVALIPDLYQRFLHNVLGVFPIERDTQGKTVENVLQGQNIGAETDIFIFSKLNDDLLGWKVTRFLYV